MPDQDKIVELRSASNPSLAYSGAVHARIGLHFDVIFEDGWPGLRHFVPGAIFLFREAKAISPNDCPVLENYAVSDTAEFADDGMRVGEKVVADLSAAVDTHETVQDGVPADDRLFVDETIG